MNNVITPVTVDLVTPSIIRKMYAKQGDDGRGALITLTENGQVYDPTGATARIFVQKSDMTQVYADCTIVSGKILALLPEQALTAAGPADVELELSTAEQVITTPIFQLVVLRSNRSGIISTDDFQALTEVLEELEDIRDNVLTPTTALAYSTPSNYSAPASGDTIQTLFGKITKGLADLFSGLSAKLDANKVLESRNITQTGYVMGGKTACEWMTELNDDMLNAKLKYEDVQLHATQNGSVTQIVNVHDGYAIPILINTGSNNWNIAVGIQIATGTLILTGDGVSASYDYTIRIYYI